MRARAAAAFLLATLSLAVGVAVTTAAEPENHPAKDEITAHFPAEPLKDACGVAVDSAGRIFVSSYFQYEIYVFDPKGKLEATVKIAAPPQPPGKKPLGGPCDLALDSAGNLYVNRWHYDVLKLTPLTPGSLSYGSGVVIDPDNSTSVTVDSSDHVFVDDRTYVAEYDSSGAPVMNGAEPVRIGAGSIESGFGVAVSGFTGKPGFPSTAGWVYVADAGDDTVKVFNPESPAPGPVEVIDGGGTPQLGFSHLDDSDLAVDDFDGHLYVVDNLQPFFDLPEAVVDEFSSRGYFRGLVPPQVATGHRSEVVDAEPSALAISARDLYLTSGNYFDENNELGYPGSKVLVFGPPVEAETRMLEATKTGAGAGIVFSSPAGLGCGTACKGEFTLGSTVLVRAMAAPHSRFAGWSGCVGSAADPLQCEVGMSEDEKVSAEFEPLAPRTLTVARSGSGAGAVFSAPAGIECGALCEAGFDEGSEVTLTAVAAAGSDVSAWSGCDSEPSPTTCRVTMGGARSVTAQFGAVPEPPHPPPPLISPSTSPVGTGSASGAGGRLRIRTLAGRAAPTLRISVPGPGELTASGRKVRTVTALPFSAGGIDLRLALNEAGLKALNRARGDKLELKVSLVFTPLDGGPAVAAGRTVAFERPKISR